MGKVYISLLHLADTVFVVVVVYFFYKLKVCGDPAWSKSFGAIFQQHLLTLCLCVTFW